MKCIEIYDRFREINKTADTGWFCKMSHAEFTRIAIDNPEGVPGAEEIADDFEFMLAAIHEVPSFIKLMHDDFMTKNVVDFVLSRDIALIKSIPDNYLTKDIMRKAVLHDGVLIMESTIEGHQILDEKIVRDALSTNHHAWGKLPKIYQTFDNMLYTFAATGHLPLGKNSVSTLVRAILHIMNNADSYTQNNQAKLTIEQWSESIAATERKVAGLKRREAFAIMGMTYKENDERALVAIGLKLHKPEVAARWMHASSVVAAFALEFHDGESLARHAMTSKVKRMILNDGLDL